MSERGQEDVDLVVAAQQGNGDAFGQLYDRWFDRVHDLSRRVVRDPEIAAEVTQDVFLVTWRQLGTLRQPESFGGWLLRATRNRSLNRLERERRSVALGDEETVMEIDRQASNAGRTDDRPADVFAQNEQEEMVWAAAAALGDRDASILHLHLRHGLDGADLAEELGVSPNAANQAMFRLRNRLGGAIRAWVLWRHGHPACETLDDTLVAAGIERFGADAVRAISAHADDCPRCGRHRAVLVAPEALFAAVPILAAPVGLKARVAGALEADGVPISSSRAPTPEPTGSVDATLVSEVVAPAPEHDEPGHTKRRTLAVAAGVLLVLLGGSLAWILSTGDDAPVTIAAPASSTTETTADADPSTTAESTTTTETTTTTTTTTSTTTTSTTVVPVPPPSAEPPPPSSPEPPPAPTPVVTSFRGEREFGDPGECLTFDQRIVLTWATENADHVTISGPDAPSGRQPASGTTVVCGAPPSGYTLTAVGPGGSATSSIDVP
ncbi:RNA polymerase sigma factor [Actinospongicola halichondriae]|uniref:RNA polymerase sigma factor n=1 Tax=Actinospongicola halichondriae TaxID=3236844 RepID=UPI003D4550F6